MNKILRFWMLMVLSTITSLTWAGSWLKTAPADLATGDVVAIVDLTSATAMSNDNGTSAAPKAVAVSISNDQAKLTAAPGNNLVWKVTVSDGSFTFNADGTNYLYCTNANNGLRVGTGENPTFTIKQSEDTGADFLFNEGQSRYVGVYNNQDWRSYTSINNNIKGCSTAFYKMVDDGTVTKQNANLSASDLTITEGETKDAVITTESDGALSFDSDNTSVATVSANGTVTAVAPGTATITVKQAETDNFFAAETSFTVTVTEYIEPGSYATVSVPYEVDFTKSQGQFVIEDETNDLGIPIWTQSERYGMTATTYVKLEGESGKTNHDGESWLVSPIIDLTEASEATLTLNDQVNAYFGNINEEFSVNVREEDGDWEDLSLIYEKPSSGWSGWEEHNVDLSAFVGSKIQVGLRYIGKEATAGTYEIKSFKVVAETVIEKQEAGLKFAENNFTAVIGEDNTFPTLENPNNLTVAWSSSHEDVATVASDGTITLVAPGSTTIKVTSEENDNFLAGSASYQLIVKEKAIAGTEVFELVTDASDLAAGDEIIIVNEDNTYALSTTQATSNRTATEVAQESDGTIIPSNLVQVITLEGEEDSWLLNVGALGYLYAPSTTANQLKSQVNPEANAYATITIDADGVAKVQFNPSVKDLRNVLRYNPNGSNPIFSCYGATSTIGSLVRIYRNTNGKLPAGLSYSETSFTATVGADNAFPTLDNPNDLDITYSSSNEGVATIDEDGNVTLVAAGTTTISATSEETDEYKAGSASYTLTVIEPEVPQTDNDNVYELVTDATTLAEGDAIILVGLNIEEAEEDGEEDTFNYYGLSMTQKANNREAVAVTYNEDGTIQGNNRLQEITLEAAESTWLFNVGDGYLYAASSNSNWLRTEAEADANAEATIAIDGEDATIIFQGTNTRNHLRFNYNNGTPLFAAYGENSTMTLPKIYRKVVAPAGLKGDVNGDKSVSIADVTMTVSYIIGGKPQGFIKENADINGDNDINIADVMAIVGIVIGS